MVSAPAVGTIRGRKVKLSSELEKIFKHILQHSLLSYFSLSIWLLVMKLVEDMP